MNILAISGSLRKDSFNTKLVQALSALAPAGMTITLFDLAHIPLYSQDFEAAFPAEAQVLKDAIEKADGIIITMPEYNRSIPGVLKNAIDWASRPYGKNSFAGKPVMTMGVSVGKLGTAVAQSHLKQILVYLDAQVVGQPELYLGPAHELFDEAGNLADEPVCELLMRALGVLAARPHMVR
jgi:NAD(P)H-dependent FMN reductase